MKVTIHLSNISSTDNPDGQVGLGKGHLALLLVLLPLLVVVDLVLAHIYSAWAAIVTAIPEQGVFFIFPKAKFFSNLLSRLWSSSGGQPLIRWYFSLSSLAKLLSQLSRGQVWGRSPVCSNLCRVTCCGRVNFLPHISQGYL